MKDKPAMVTMVKKNYFVIYTLNFGCHLKTVNWISKIVPWTHFPPVILTQFIKGDRFTYLSHFQSLLTNTLSYCVQVPIFKHRTSFRLFPTWIAYDYINKMNLKYYRNIWFQQHYQSRPESIWPYFWPICNWHATVFT